MLFIYFFFRYVGEKGGTCCGLNLVSRSRPDYYYVITAAVVFGVVSLCAVTALITSAYKKGYESWTFQPLISDSELLKVCRFINFCLFEPELLVYISIF